jgi:DNA polymerase-3 subunit delta
VKIARGRIEAFLSRPEPGIRAVLAYGPDSGLVNERLGKLMTGIVPDPSDPFRIAVLTPASLAEDPARLADEAAAIAFGGGRRVVLIRGAGDSASGALAGFLADPMGDALVLVAAGELAARSSLRRLFDAADNAASIACYPDEGHDLAEVIHEALTTNNLAAEPDAAAWLSAHLGGDRMIVRAEIGKLALYMDAPRSPGPVRVNLADVMSAVGDVVMIDQDDLIAAAAGGDQERAQRALDKLLSEGTSPITILRALARYFQRLHLLAGRVAGGMRPDQAVGSLKPPLPFFRLVNQLTADIPRWPAANVARAMALIETAEIDCKSTGMPAEAILGRAVLQIARAAAAGRR